MTSSESDSDGALYALDAGKVLIGDVVLTTGDGCPSWVIRTVTQSPFSHAAICTRPDLLIEAQPTGITRALVSMTCSPSIQSLAVLRLKPGISRDESFGLSVADFAESFYGREYSVGGAITSPFPGKGPDSGSALFCSQLVVEAYRSVGVELLPGLEPNKVVPGDLIRSEVLQNVTESAVRMVRREDSEVEYLVLLDGPAMGIPHGEMEVNRRVVKRIGQCMERMGHSKPDSLPHAYWILEYVTRSDGTGRAAELDSCFLEAFSAEGFFEWYADQDARLRTSIDDLLKVKDFVQSHQTPRAQRVETSRVLRFVIGERDSDERRRETFEEMRKLAMSTRLETFRLLAGLYHRQWQTERHRRAALQQVIAVLES